MFGVVGSGKSEQAKRLVDKLKIPHISTSQLLRNEGKPEWYQLMIAGKLVPDEDVTAVLDAAFKRINAAKEEFILDGAPRSIVQAQWLDSKIKNGLVKLTTIIHLKVSRETTIARMLKRGREDDTEMVISERFKQYEDKTIPVLDYLRGQGYEILDIDGEWSADVVERQIWLALEGKLAP